MIYKPKFPKPNQRKKTAKRAKRKENPLTEKILDYADLCQVRYIRIPDSLYMWIFADWSPVPAHIKKIASVALKGLPDTIFFKPDGKYNSAFISEQKSDVGSVRDCQKNWHKGLNVEIDRDFQEFKLKFDEWLNN